MKKIIILLLFTAITTVSVKADIVQPNTTIREFSISNLNGFKGYKFYYIFQGYHYDMGYQPNKPDTLLVENNTRYKATSRGNHTTVLLALDSLGNWYSSSVEMGGQSNMERKKPKKPVQDLLLSLVQMILPKVSALQL